MHAIEGTTYTLLKERENKALAATAEPKRNTDPTQWREKEPKSKLAPMIIGAGLREKERGRKSERERERVRR